MIFLFVKHSVHIAIPGRGVEPLQGFGHHAHTLASTCDLFSFVFRGDKSRPPADPHSARGSIKRVITSSLIFSFILSYERTKVKKKKTVVNQDCHRSVCIGFVSENLCVKLLPPFLRLPFVFFEVTGAYWTCPVSYAQVLSIFVPRHISRLLEIILYSVGD